MSNIVTSKISDEAGFADPVRVDRRAGARLGRNLFRLLIGPAVWITSLVAPGMALAGACCSGNNVCADVTADDCIAQQGIYLGGACLSASCGFCTWNFDPGSGACSSAMCTGDGGACLSPCLSIPDPACWITWPPVCCIPAIHPVTQGSCLFLTDPLECASRGGTAMANCNACQVCCAPGGCQAISDPVACAALGGVSNPDCATCPPPPNLEATIQIVAGSIHYGAPQGGAFDLIRGLLANLHDTGTIIDLGPVTCVADDDASRDLSDPTLPPPDQVFFYLLGQDSAPEKYGTSGGKPLRPASGDCP